MGVLAEKWASCPKNGRPARKWARYYMSVVRPKTGHGAEAGGAAWIGCEVQDWDRSMDRQTNGHMLLNIGFVVGMS